MLKRKEILICFVLLLLLLLLLLFVLLLFVFCCLFFVSFVLFLCFVVVVLLLFSVISFCGVPASETVFLKNMCICVLFKTWKRDLSNLLLALSIS